MVLPLRRSFSVANLDDKLKHFNGSNPAIVYAGTSIGGDAFAVKLAPSGATLDYLVNLGGSENEEARGVALDSDGNAYIAGLTRSQNFPLMNGFNLFQEVRPTLL